MNDSCNEYSCKFVISSQLMNVECHKERLRVKRKAEMAEKLSDHVMMFSESTLCDNPMNTDEKPVEFGVSYAVHRKIMI